MPFGVTGGSEAQSSVEGRLAQRPAEPAEAELRKWRELVKVVEQLIADRLTLSHCPRRELPETAVSGTRRPGRGARGPGWARLKAGGLGPLFFVFDDANLVPF
jgi:hypothetical protein